MKDLVTKKAASYLKMTADKGKTEAMKLYARITFFGLSGIPADKKESSFNFNAKSFVKNTINIFSFIRLLFFNFRIIEFYWNMVSIINQIYC